METDRHRQINKQTQTDRQKEESRIQWPRHIFCDKGKSTLHRDLSRLQPWNQLHESLIKCW